MKINVTVAVSGDPARRLGDRARILSAGSTRRLERESPTSCSRWRSCNGPPAPSAPPTPRPAATPGTRRPPRLGRHPVTVSDPPGLTPQAVGSRQ